VKALGIIALVLLILIGALMPLKYTARMKLPAKGKEPPDPAEAGAGDVKRRGSD
jgi:hypothetical protein